MLVEVCIGLTLIALVLLGIMGAFTMSVRSLTAARDKETTTMVALGVLNELEGVTFDLMSTYRENSLDVPDGYVVKTTFDPASPALTHKSLNVVVSAKREGADRAVTLERSISNMRYQ